MYHSIPLILNMWTSGNNEQRYHDIAMIKRLLLYLLRSIRMQLNITMMVKIKNKVMRYHKNPIVLFADCGVINMYRNEFKLKLRSTVERPAKEYLIINMTMPNIM